MIKLLSLLMCASALLSLSLATRSESIVGCYEHDGSRLSIYDNGKAYTDVDRCNVFDWFYDEDKQLLRLCNPQCFVRGPTDPCRGDSLVYEVEFKRGNLCLKPKGCAECRSALNTERWEWTRCAECLESCACSTDCRELSGCYASDDKKYLVVGEHQLVITGRNDLCVMYPYESNRSAITIGREVCDTKCCDDEAFYFCDIRPDHTVLYYYNHECKEYLGTTWTSVSSNKRECCDECRCKDESSYGSHGSSDSRGSAHSSSKGSWGKGKGSYGSHESSDSRGSGHYSSKGSWGKGKGSYGSHESSDSRGSGHYSSKGSWGTGKGSYGGKGSSYGSSYGSKGSSYGSKGSSYASSGRYSQSSSRSKWD